MKRLVITVTIIFILVALAAAGCAEKGPAIAPQEGEEVGSTCVSCHSDKDLLKQTATIVEAKKSESTSGEG